MNIKLNNLVFSGIHGWTEKEKTKPQRFKIDIECVTSVSSAGNDILENTVDYRKIKKITKEIIDGPSMLLIETVAEKIVDRILKEEKILYVRLELSKVDIWDNGCPGVVCEKYKNFTDLVDFNFDYVLAEIMRIGAVSIPLLNKEKRLTLLSEAESYTYVKQPETVGKMKVREQLSSYEILKPDSLFHALHEDITELLNCKLNHSRFSRAVDTFSFNELTLQKYAPDSIGVTPHLDNFSCKQFIIIIILKGTADFAICENREGVNPIYLDTTPGNAIIMRAPGLYGSNKRPFHFVSNIPEERIIFTLRNNIKIQVG